MENQAQIPVETLADRTIPDKLFFRIGEVVRLAGVKAHVLRYWETEFPAVQPRKMGSNHRLYRRKDVELILEIKRLLYEKRFTIEGARKYLEDRQRNRTPAAAAAPVQTALFAVPAAASLQAIRKEIQEILKLLGR